MCRTGNCLWSTPLRGTRPTQILLSSDRIQPHALRAKPTTRWLFQRGLPVPLFTVARVFLACGWTSQFWRWTCLGAAGFARCDQAFQQRCVFLPAAYRDKAPLAQAICTWRFLLVETHSPVLRLLSPFWRFLCYYPCRPTPASRSTRW